MAAKKSKKRTRSKSSHRPRDATVRGMGPKRLPPAKDEGIEVIARGCLVEGSRILLCRNLKHGYLYLPGGHVEFDESAREALRREFLEECGLPVRVGDLALLSEGAFETKKRRHHEINVVFHVERVGSPRRAVVSQEDGIAFEWLDFAAIPDSDIRPHAAKAFLATLGSQPGHVEWVSEFGAE